ncbi:GPCR fungal pheromone mating factor [Poronia punctata]|nr:GPCR fungal pheromone mating factor [Poronia punctata]
MTNHLLLANLISRIILATVGILLCWVPFRLLSRNGEFAGAVLIIDVSLMNLFTIINSIIWHTDDVKTWWDGSGLCDLEVYLWSPLQTIYAAAIFTIMFHLAQQVKVGRRSRRRNLVILQAAFIFPIPVFQLAFTYFDLAQRYIVGTGIGCSAVYDSSWPTMVVYDVPPALFALLSVPYAVLLWIRYRALTKQTQGILNSTTPSSIRTRRRLYNMSLSILTVYLPVMMYLFVLSVKDALASYKPYNFHRMRYQASPYPWSSILFVPSSIIPSSVMNQPWIPIATTVVITTFFGTTTEARAMYSRYADALGLWKRGERFGGGTGTGTLHSQRILLASNQR